MQVSTGPVPVPVPGQFTENEAGWEVMALGVTTLSCCHPETVLAGAPTVHVALTTFEPGPSNATVCSSGCAPSLRSQTYVTVPAPLAVMVPKNVNVAGHVLLSLGVTEADKPLTAKTPASASRISTSARAIFSPPSFVARSSYVVVNSGASISRAPFGPTAPRPGSMLTDVAPLVSH